MRRHFIGMALVLTQHLDPTHASHLTEILSRESKLPVIEVTDGVRVESEMGKGSRFLVSLPVGGEAPGGTEVNA